MGILGFILSHWRVFSVIACFLAGLGLYALGHNDGRQDAALDAAKAAANAIQKRANVDEEIIGMDAVALCLELGGLRDECRKLRRMEADKP
ncbi:hypothetical protein F9L06_08035 [Brucella anthropi]|uniref:Uncharacterized protein n=1 Tax=Brucella anthropi TaxID=529 RepID=A0A6I0DRK0_BRUAN|nr:hypothetical protein [Brucella anthropi]KAB2801618.1 hypothetical protein F9L06_08035 [Brucella anthropi]